jgi:hypothetical protein
MDGATTRPLTPAMRAALTDETAHYVAFAWWAAVAIAACSALVTWGLDRPPPAVALRLFLTLLAVATPTFEAVALYYVARGWRDRLGGRYRRYDGLFTPRVRGDAVRLALAHGGPVRLEGADKATAAMIAAAAGGTLLATARSRRALAVWDGEGLLLYRFPWYDPSTDPDLGPP